MCPLLRPPQASQTSFCSQLGVFSLLANALLHCGGTLLAASLQKGENSNASSRTSGMNTSMRDLCFPLGVVVLERECDARIHGNSKDIQAYAVEVPSL